MALQKIFHCELAHQAHPGARGLAHRRCIKVGADDLGLAHELLLGTLPLVMLARRRIAPADHEMLQNQQHRHPGFRLMTEQRFTHLGSVVADV